MTTWRTLMWVLIYWQGYPTDMDDAIEYWLRGQTIPGSMYF